MSYTIFGVTLAIATVFILFMTFVSYFLYKGIRSWTKPKNDDRLRDMQKKEYKEGKFGKDEIGQLVGSFNGMESALKTQMKNVAMMTAEKEKVQAEMDVAMRIQMDALPQNFSDIAARGFCDIYGSMSPAKEVGGDFYDFFEIDEDKLCLVIADVSGKGVPGALFMMISKVLLKHRAVLGGTPAEILEDVNNQLCEENKAMLFVTVWLGILDLKKEELCYSNAGHEFPVLLRDDEVTVLEETSNDPPLALAENFTFSDKKITMHKGDGLFVYTDGIPEAKNPEEERYGMERMTKVLGQYKPDASCQEVVDAMVADVDSFAGEREHFDDVTMLMIRFLQTSSADI